MRSRLSILLLLLLTVAGLRAQDAKALRAQANAENNQEHVVKLLCKAAAAEPNNKDYRKDCDNGRAALIASDKTMLKTAQDASDAGKITTAMRDAKNVSSFDPELHRQAELLLTKLKGTIDLPKPPAESQNSVLTQALASYNAGNLQAARSGAQSITDASLKPAASRLMGEIDRYGNMVSAGQRHEQARDFVDAEKSYQAALELNGHVASDDVAGRVQRMRAAAAAAQTALASGKTPVGTAVIPKLPLPITPEEKKRRLFEEIAQATSRNDIDGANRRYKQVLEIDPANAEAKQGLARIAEALNRDPVKLETTLREAIVAFYASRFEDAESRFNRYLGADKAKKKGAAYFYLGATEVTLAMLADASQRGSRNREAQEDFKQAREAGYQPVEQYVSARVLAVWKSPGT